MDTMNIMQLDDKARMYECLSQRGFGAMLIPTKVIPAEKVLTYLARQSGDNQILFAKHSEGYCSREVHRGTAEQLGKRKKLVRQLESIGGTWVLQPKTGNGMEVRVYTRFDGNGGKVIMPAYSIRTRLWSRQYPPRGEMKLFEETRPLFYRHVLDLLKHVHLPQGMSTRIVTFDFLLDDNRVFLLEINADVESEQSLLAFDERLHVALIDDRMLLKDRVHTWHDRWDPATYIAIATNSEPNTGK